MPAAASRMTAIERVDLDTDETKLPVNTASFVKGWIWEINKNPSGGEGYNAGVATPREGSKIISAPITLPAGTNYCVGYHESRDTNEGYWFIWNENADHLICRVRGIDGVCEKVYQKKYLDFQLDPRYFITEGRCVVKTVQYYNKATGQTERNTFLLFTNNYGQPRMLCVEAAILTNSFDDTTYPFFDPLVTGQPAIDQVLEKYINLAVATPMECISYTPQDRLESDKHKQNLLLYKGWQWRLKYIDVWNRESEHGIISERYFTVIGSNCLAANSGMPRCVRLKFYAGNPLVNKIVIEFRQCSGNTDLSVDSDWYVYDTIDKYDNSGELQFWERPILNPYQTLFDEMTIGGATEEEIEEATALLTKYDDSDHTFEYSFCADKQCQPIAVSETQRTHNLIPRKSESLFALNEGIGLANNLRQYEPLLPEVIEKISVEAIPPSGDCDDFELRTIIVYAAIYRPLNVGTGCTVGVVQYLSIPEPDEYSEVLLSSCGGTDTVKFTTCWGRITSATAAAFLGQVFPQGQDNFVAYLAGTNYAVTGTQVRMNVTTFDECEIGIFNEDGTRNTASCDSFEGLEFQKFEFKVPPGEYIVRLAHHRARISEEYASTSTYVAGKMTFNSFINSAPGAFGGGGTLSNPTDRVKEMAVDVTTTDYTNHSDVFAIMDFIDPDESVGDLAGYEYYMKEDQVGNVPIALAELVNVAFIVNADITKWTSYYTDHNGFYFSGKKLLRDSIEFFVRIERCDPPDPAYPYYAPSWPGFAGGPVAWAAQLCLHSVVSTPAFVNFLYSDLDEFPEEDRRTIKGRILLCGDANIGISGVPIVPHHLTPSRTDSNGEWTVIAHGRDGVGTRALTDTILISQNVCQYTDCEDPCDFKFDHIVVAYIDCQAEPRLTTVDDIRLAVKGINKSGPQNGGRYQFGIVCHDGNGRHNYVQTADHLIVDVKSMLETHRFAHSTFQFTLGPGFVLPSWVQYITFVVTRNLNWDDFFMWSADRISFVDAAGIENASNPTKIRIYYESMIEYLKQNNMNDNAIWQFTTTGTDQVNTVVGDVIEFYRNGDGTWMDKSILSDVRYNKEGKYIEIDYIPDFDDLTDGALFKIIRPKICQVNELFFELCPSVKVVDGEPEVTSGQLSYQDSYFLTRQFPVPIYTEDPDDPTIITKTVNVRFSIYYYEHHSPSDFWGSHCGTRGRVFYKNPYEREQYLGMETALSKALVNRSNFNGLSYFEEVDITRFEEQEWGSITAVLPEINTVLFICRRNNFIAGYNDTLARANADGNIYAGTPLGKWGRPQPKIGQTGGCQPQDINTIRKKDGVVLFLDRSKGGVILHVYTQSTDISARGFQGWLMQKLEYQNALNNQEFAARNYFVAGINPKTNEYYLTSFTVPSFGSPEVPGSWDVPDGNYVNDFKIVDRTKNETIVIDLLTASFKGFAHFTPEYYGAMESFHADNNMFVFRRGQAWSLHSGDDTVPRLNYFGTQCGKVLEIVVNISPNKVKRFMYAQVFNDGHKLVANYIETQTGQLSRLKASRWTRFNRFWAAEFLCATNSIPDSNMPVATGANALFDGDPLTGRWMKIRFESETADNASYCELSGIDVFCIEEGKSGQ